MNIKELEYILQEGESYFVEFKEMVNRSLSRELAAFANASGAGYSLGLMIMETSKGLKIQTRFGLRFRILHLTANLPLQFTSHPLERL